MSVYFNLVTAIRPTWLNVPVAASFHGSGKGPKAIVTTCFPVELVNMPKPCLLLQHERLACRKSLAVAERAAHLAWQALLLQAPDETMDIQQSQAGVLANYRSGEC
jgi:hypothetical protein